jgi:hypothetical protein
LISRKRYQSVVIIIIELLVSVCGKNIIDKEVTDVRNTNYEKYNHPCFVSQRPSEKTKINLRVIG